MKVCLHSRKTVQISIQFDKKFQNSDLWNWVRICDFLRYVQTLCQISKMSHSWWTEDGLKLQSLIMLRMASINFSTAFLPCNSMLMLKAKRRTFFSRCTMIQNAISWFKKSNKSQVFVSLCLFSRQGVWSQEQNVTKGTFWGHDHTHSSSHTIRPRKRPCGLDNLRSRAR